MKTMMIAYLLMAMQVADVVLTYISIKAGAREANPMMVALQKILPGKWTWLFLTKAIFIGVVYWFASTYGATTEPVLYGLIVIYAWVLWNNYRVWRRVK